VAAAHPPAAGAACQVRLRRRGRRCGQALDSIISAGCIVSGSRVSASVLCPNVRVHSFCDVDQSILMPGVRVGRHARIRRAIIDRDVFIPRGAQIGYNEDEDRRRTPSATTASWL
jgi:glucose-1-phosphate adenylyltransferase